jgi:diketogulonate reductase-like aldo/keto reductase
VGKAVSTAIELGYRHIDCAPLYENEREIGEALAEKIQDGTVTRKELFIATKVNNPTLLLDTLLLDGLTN